MENKVVKILQNHCEHWQGLIPMLENGVISTGEMRDGHRADTTQETLERTRQLLAETIELIAEIESGKV